MIVVVPILNEHDNAVRLMDSYLQERIKLFDYSNTQTYMVFVDDTKYNYKRTRLHTQGFSFTKYIRGDNSYGGSVIKGLKYALSYTNPDKIMIMDVDHPEKTIKEMIWMLDLFDAVIGYDTVSNKERKVTKFLCKHMLGLNLIHPTCGFVGFNSGVLNKIEFWNIKYEKDLFHVEMMKRVLDNNMKIGQIPFNSKHTKHDYCLSRYLKWIYDFLNIVYTDKYT